ncbi:hypothetical protein [Streptomyces sp. SLBN-134]|uniref:hypothetical protein n=1 Tax=Streptomyces sp. SLBN-134 TaxID=2768456 RepID=UPI00115455F2|nr:hypothetical protein [Streptomyces sp. SLBN-134]TQL18243.1 hypothetical protein FBY37_0138 [Streptomyces sp. SLBN-134]
MNEHISTRVDSPHAPVHAGSGDLYVTMGAQLQDPDRPTFRRLADDHLGWLRKVLVAPAGMGAARHMLTDTGTVILDGPPGSGRTSVSRVLLREYDQGTGVFHELLPDEQDELSLSNPALVGTGDQLLLDLSAATAVQWAAARADLSALRKAVHEQHAHLVVVMPYGHPLDPDLQHYRINIDPPDGLEVFRRHLRFHGVAYEPDPTVTAFLAESRPMREIADFADLVRRAREAAAGEGFARWCTTARKARDDRRAETARLVAELREGPQRALLITVAMLHGAHADVIHRAAQLLLHTLKFPPDEQSVLEGKDLAERLAEIPAGTGPDGHVRFTELDYDAAVRAHFWDHMPDLRQPMGTWVAHTVDSDDPNVTRALRDSLVARLAEQYLRTGRGERLASLAEDWSTTTTTRTTSQARLEAAVHALTCGLNDPAHGRNFRHWIYLWCAQRQLRGEFAQVLVQVCADVIAASHPDQALFRLYHLARREQGTSRALQALCDLVATSSRLRRRLLDRLARSPFSAAELRIFLSACDPVPLTARHDNGNTLIEENGARESLTIGWRAVLNDLSHAEWHPYAERWLHSAAELGHRGDPLLDLLVAAADRCGGHRGTAFAELYASARAAERAAPHSAAGATATTDLLLQKISTAQDLGPSAAPLSTASPGGTAP